VLASVIQSEKPSSGHCCDVGERAGCEIDHLVGAGDLAFVACEAGDRGVGVEVVGPDHRRRLGQLVGLDQVLHQPLE
jgi:hypothetical protein